MLSAGVNLLRDSDTLRKVTVDPKIRKQSQWQSQLQ